MIISLSGMPGSGKSTVAKILEKELAMKRYYMGEIRRKMAEDQGISLAQLNKRGESDPTSDHEVDEYQRRLGEKEDDFIIEGRTSFHFIPRSLKIFLDCDIEVGAERIYKEERGSVEQYPSVEAAVKGLKARIESDRKRYLTYYGFDCYDHKHYDFVVDTTHLTIKESAAEVLSYIRKRMKGGGQKGSSSKK